MRMLGPVIGELIAKREKLRLVAFHNCGEHDCKTHGNWAKGIKKQGDPAVEGKGSGVPKGPFDASQFDEKKGKPILGTDAWLSAHNISREVYEDRPYHRFELGDTFDSLPDDIQALYEGEPEAARQLNKVMRQEAGVILVRKAVPGVKEPNIVPQARPDAAVVLDEGELRLRRTIHNSTVENLERAKNLDDAGVVALQKERVEAAKQRILDAETMTREKYLERNTTRISEAQAEVDRLKAEGHGSDSQELKDARKKVSTAKQRLKEKEADANHKFGKPGAADEAERTEAFKNVLRENARKGLINAEKKLIRVEGDPKTAIQDEIKNATKNEKDAKAQLDGVPVKYVFPPNPSRLQSDIDKGTIMGKAGRVNLHGEENIRRFMETKGRVYLAMEGNMKEDSVLTAIEQEGEPDASVISVPSVTLWRHGEMAEVASKHLRGREVVLIPDADGVNNPRVRNEARAMQTMLESYGAKVIVAPPPIPLDSNGDPVPDPKDDNKVLQYEEPIVSSPKNTMEQLKGVDDYLGVGKGSNTGGRVGPEKGYLGGLAVQQRTVPEIDFLKVGPTDPGSGINTQAKPGAEAALRGLSNILGPVGAGRVGTKMLSAAMGKFYDHGMSASRALGYLEKDGLIKIERVYDPEELLNGRRTMHPDMTVERVNELVKGGIIERPSFDDHDLRSVEAGEVETPVITVRREYRAVDGPPISLSKLPSSRKNITPARIKSLQGMGKTLEEIADILDISVSSVSKKLSG